MIYVEYDCSGYGEWVFKGVFTDIKTARSKALNWCLSGDYEDDISSDDELENSFRFCEVKVNEWVGL